MKPLQVFTPVAGVGSHRPIDTIVLLKRKEQATLDNLPVGGKN